jgi:hypothetical protein
LIKGSQQMSGHGSPEYSSGDRGAVIGAVIGGFFLGVIDG